VPAVSAIIQFLGLAAKLSEPARRTATFDNGSQFAEAQALSNKTDDQTFFCAPLVFISLSR
jgi:IS30 family transposase